ncbi:MAG: Uxx-star family glutaredoxin-like (seleno)protein [Bacillota bacterium]|nr:Uxx-star family glutaredoxin-like (seleno)protein [Bacillota bacterium]
MRVAVLVYTTPSCPYCRATKRFLAERKVPYREIDVSKSPAAAREVVRKSGQMGVPVIDVNGQIIVGFDRARLVRALGLRE